MSRSAVRELDEIFSCGDNFTFIMQTALRIIYQSCQKTCYKISQKSDSPVVFSMSNINISNPSKQQASLLLCVSDSIFRVLVFIPTYGTVITEQILSYGLRCSFKYFHIRNNNIQALTENK